KRTITDSVVLAYTTLFRSRTGLTYTTSQVVKFPVPNGVCTDTIRLNLTIDNPVVTDTVVTACGSFTWDRTGINYTTGGSYDFPVFNERCTHTIRYQLTLSN